MTTSRTETRRKRNHHSLSNLAADLNQTTIDFIKIDLNSVTVFANVARQSQDEEIRGRNIANARHGCETVRRFLTRVALSDEEATDIQNQLAFLEATLAELSDQSK